MAIDWQSLTDESLMMQFKDGQHSAFEVLLDRHQEGVYRYIFRFFGNQQTAEESTQEVFLKIVRSAPHYEPRSKFTTWMYRIVHNYCIDVFRRQKLRRTVSLDETTGPGNEGVTRLETIPSNEDHVDDQIVDKQLHDIVQDALEKLNPDQREVFLLREKSGLAFHEIAEVLDISTNTVKSRMRYALATLKKELQKTIQPKKQVVTL